MKSILESFVLFSLLESLIFCYFFYKIGKVKRFRIYEVVMLAVINCMCIYILPNIVSQCFGILYMSLFLILRDNIGLKKALKLTLCVNILTLLIEVANSLILENLHIIKLYNCADMGERFLYLLPIKLLTVFIIYKGGEKNEVVDWFN